MACENCYTGCASIISDQCVRYTGIDIPFLEIYYGDSLDCVERAITDYLTLVSSGLGIIIDISEQDCTYITDLLPEEVTEFTALDVFQALVSAACDLNSRVASAQLQLDILNANYTIGCLTGVTSSSDTHDIVQATITKLCQVDAALTALAVNVDANYVKLVDLNTLIQAYLDSINPIPQINQRMVPYTAVEYYPPADNLDNFDATGAGISALGWDKVYLCNGQNGTPDKRGWIPVGVSVVKGGLDDYLPEVDPAISSNPNYALFDTEGNNNITLTTNQIPSHTHLATASSVVTDPGHGHSLIADTYAGNDGRGTAVSSSGDDVFNWESGKVNADVVDTSLTKITVATTVTNAPQGAGQSHSNIPPVKACYYIIYIP